MKVEKPSAQNEAEAGTTIMTEKRPPAATTDAELDGGKSNTRGKCPHIWGQHEAQLQTVVGAGALSD